MPLTKRQESERLVAARLAALNWWCDLAAWHRSKKGNPCRELDGLTVTIFRRYAKFKWSVSENGDTLYSDEMFEAEEDAIFAVGRVVGIGY